MSALTKAGFDAGRWQAARGLDDSQPNPRGGMLDTLEQGPLRKGMSRDAVRRLLGESDGATPTTDEYDLGRSPVGVTIEIYIVEYDAQGRVVSFALRRQ